MLERDGHRCQYREVRKGSRRCLKPATHVDHIIPAYVMQDDSMRNLWALCTEHHARKTGREGRDSQGYSKRGPEPHPGMMRDA